MSSPTDCRGTDQFQPNHRAGYGDRLTFLMDWLTDHPDATLASGEGRVLRDEIVRLRAMVERVRFLCERADEKTADGYVDAYSILDALEDV
jgi:hypothetical protein